MDSLHFSEYFDKEFSIEEKKLIPHLKRFFECVLGDPDFYDAVKETPADCVQLLESRGIFGVDPVEMAILVNEIPLHKEFPITESQDKPQAILWQRWLKVTRQFREEWRQRNNNETPNSKFNAWHSRNVNRCSSQVPKIINDRIIHATIIFELSKGCSLHCPFCGLASEPLQDIFLYTEQNSRLWKEALKVAVRQLGTTVGAGVCYWATDPTDNPDYFKFLEDFREATGIYPQTTTAAPLRNLDWTRKLLQIRKKYTTASDRFSILSKNVLRRVHEIFTAEELSLTSLLLQYSELNKNSMARAGRNRKVADSTTDIAKDYTIACATGYLVNMVDRSVKLISPCPPSGDTPLGYRVYAEGNFSSAAELNDFIVGTIDELMPTKVGSEQLLAFRHDLEFTVVPGGFQLQSKYKSHKFVGAPYLTELGRLVAEGNLTSSKVVNKLMDEYSNFIAIMSSIQKLFDQGLLE